MPETKVIYAASLNPHRTLAAEEALLETAAGDTAILYLYRHHDSVIIGRNQNAWAECRHEELLADGGFLARRISGGGAVYHDPQNLNFSFIVPRRLYDLHRQCAVILDAVRSLGIEAEFTGRNDIVTGGRKFSGNAFCIRKNAAFHHGTILIRTDPDKIQHYLTVSPEKIRTKGISSVRSRVINLCEVRHDLTPEIVGDALVKSFGREYGTATIGGLSEEAAVRAALLAERNASWEWLYGHTPQFDISFSERLAWGGIEFRFSLKGAIVEAAGVFSDAMETSFISRLPDALMGQPFRPDDLMRAVQKCAPSDSSGKKLADDICSVLAAHV